MPQDIPTVAPAGRSNEPLDPLIFAIRNQRVILDNDLTRIYGVPTKALNQAVKRNAERFPVDFAFQLSRLELANLKSQVMTSSGKTTQYHGYRKRWSQSVTTSQQYRRTGFRPWAFTEHGALMAANVLRGERAVQMSIFVTRAFVRLREHAAANAAILKRLAEIDKTLLQHDAASRDVYRKLQPPLVPPPQPAKRRIGF
jgi:ORF6N domain